MQYTIPVKKIKQLTPIENLKDIQSGEDILILGSGQSLSNLTGVPTGIFTCAINHTIGKVITDSFALQDKKMYSHLKKYPNHPALSFHFERENNTYLQTGFQGFKIQVVHCAKKRLRFEKNTLHTACLLTGWCMIALAHYFGFKNIYILGFDGYEKESTKVKYAFAHPDHGLGRTENNVRALIYSQMQYINEYEIPWNIIDLKKYPDKIKEISNKSSKNKALDKFKEYVSV